MCSESQYICVEMVSESNINTRSYVQFQSLLSLNRLFFKIKSGILGFCLIILLTNFPLKSASFLYLFNPVVSIFSKIKYRWCRFQGTILVLSSPNKVKTILCSSQCSFSHTQALSNNLNLWKLMSFKTEPTGKYFSPSFH